VNDAISNLYIPQSVIDMLSSLAERFGQSLESEGTVSIQKGELVVRTHDLNDMTDIRDRFLNAIKLCEATGETIKLLSDAVKSSDPLEKNIRSEFVDASILARQESAIVLTDDYLYLRIVKEGLDHEIPPYFSSLALVRAMYELGILKFDDYLNYVGLTSSYRFRFISISASDIEKAIFGDELVKNIRLERLAYLNLGLTLSEEYGVTKQECIRVLSFVAANLIRDDSVTIELAEKIFIELIELLPKDYNKLEMINLITAECEKMIRHSAGTSILYLNSKDIRAKLEKLANLKTVFT